jgi:hypothetical protein
MGALPAAGHGKGMTGRRWGGFTKRGSSAIRLWEAIPEMHRQQILDNVFCSHCSDMCRIEDFTGIKELVDLMLRGFCGKCGNVVVRLVETPEEKSRG